MSTARGVASGAVTANAIERDEISHRKFQRPEALEALQLHLRAPEIPERDGHSRDPYERRQVPRWDPKFLMAPRAGHTRPDGRLRLRRDRRRQHGDEIDVVVAPPASQLGAVVNDAAHIDETSSPIHSTYFFAGSSAGLT